MAKIKHLIYTALLSVCLISIISCKNDNEQTTEAQRTILVYMAAYNSLGSAGADTLDINEMVKAAKEYGFNGGRLILYHSDVYGNQTLNEVTANGVVKLKSYEDGLTSVYAKRMSDVIADTKRIAPAKQYGIILWSHGDGWLQNGIENDEVSRGTKFKAFGLESGKKMNITTLANVLDGQNFSFIYFDCCYMASVEAEYELRNAAPYIVGSVSELPVDGMPYDQNLRYLFADNADLVGAAQNTFNLYNNQTGFWQTCTMSVVRTSGLDALAAATREIYRKAETCYPANYKPQKFMTESSCYYFDFADYVKVLASDEDYVEWQTALNNCIVYAAATPTLWQTLAINSHCGLSTYILSDEDDALAARRNYNTLSWYDDVVSALFNK